MLIGFFKFRSAAAFFVILFGKVNMNIEFTVRGAKNTVSVTAPRRQWGKEAICWSGYGFWTKSSQIHVASSGQTTTY